MTTASSGMTGIPRNMVLNNDNMVIMLSLAGINRPQTLVPISLYKSGLITELRGRMLRENTWYHGDISTTSAVWRAQQTRKGSQQQKSVAHTKVTLRLSLLFVRLCAPGPATAALFDKTAIKIWHTATETKQRK